MYQHVGLVRRSKWRNGLLAHVVDNGARLLTGGIEHWRKRCVLNRKQAALPLAGYVANAPRNTLPARRRRAQRRLAKRLKLPAAVDPQ